MSSINDMIFFEGNNSTMTPGPHESGFTICAQPSSDVWDSSPATHRFNAPILYQAMPLAAFQRAQVTLSADLSSDYEQCGLLLVIHYADGSKKWIKSGIEFAHGSATAGTVAKDQWPDWSIGPVYSPGDKLTVELVRETLGLAVYLVKPTGEKNLQRELSWVFEGSDAEQCWVGAYAANPGAEGPNVTAYFENLVIERKDS